MLRQTWLVELLSFVNINFAIVTNWTVKIYDIIKKHHYVLSQIVFQ